MKTALKMAAAALFLAIALSSCGSESKTMNENQNWKATAQEAAKAAQEDFAKAVAQTEDLDLGITADEISGASIGREFSVKMLDFDDLQKSDSTTTLVDISSAEMHTVVPLTSGGNILQIMTLEQDTKGWRIAGLGDQNLTKQLNQVTKASGSDEVVLYEVPNLNVRIFQVGKAGKAVFYTDYEGSSLRQAIDLRQLLPQLAKDAQAFQKAFGDQLKNQKLVR